MFPGERAMKIRVEEIPEEGKAFEIKEGAEPYNAVLVGDQSSYRFSDFLIGSLRVNRIGDTVLIEGVGEGSLVASCHRCLEEFKRELKIPVSVSLLPWKEEDLPEELELSSEDLENETYRDGIVDLSEVLREQIMLSLPISIYCSEKCRGLCPHCGVNLNKEECRCKEEKISPHFAALKNWKAKS